MKNLAKAIVISVFGLCTLLLFLGNSSETISSAAVEPTPPPTNRRAANNNTATNVNSAANTANKSPVSNVNTAPVAAPVASHTPAMPSNASAATPDPNGKKIPKEFTLGTDSLDSEKGEVPFDHDTHAFQKYAADGQSVMACTECHHTDQPKSALKPPLLTSERDQTLTFAFWQSSNIKVTHCRDCHFQAGNVPAGKVMPTATYTEGGKSVTKTLDNQLAYHLNCNTCHDSAAKLRPELLKKPGFAVGKDCMRCHKPIE
jgi:hypothetical protein